MASLNGFNAAEVEPNEGFDPVPAGEYVAAIVESEEKATSAGTGSYIKLKIQILDGPHKGRKLFENLNLNNPSQQAVQIARGTLSAICRAAGVLQPKDTVELHNIPVLIKVGMRKREDTGELQNRITSWKPKGGGSPASAGGGGTTTPPWKQRT